MKLREVTYGRLFNTGNFENEKYEVVAELEEGEDPEKVAQNLKDLILAMRDANREEPVRKPPKRKPPVRKS